MAQTADIGTNRRVIVHCGVQKTASTSLHRFVQRNREALAGRLEVLTPAKGTLTRRLGRAAMQYSLDPSTAAEQRLADLVRALSDDLAGGAGPVLVSHENLPGAMIGKGGVVTLYPHLERIVALLDAGLAPMVPEYVFYTRDMGPWKRSVHNQAVKSDHYSGTYRQFLVETAKCGTWEELEARMQALVGAARVRFFRLEDEPDERRPGRQLLCHAGLTEAEVDALSPMKQRSNTRLNDGALEFLRLVNLLGLDRTARAKIADLVTANQTLFQAGEA